MLGQDRSGSAGRSRERDHRAGKAGSVASRAFRAETIEPNDPLGHFPEDGSPYRCGLHLQQLRADERPCTTARGVDRGRGREFRDPRPASRIGATPSGGSPCTKRALPA